MATHRPIRFHIRSKLIVSAFVGGGAAAASATRYSPLQILLKKSFSVLLRSILWSDTLQGKQGKCTANQCNQEIMTEIH